MNTKLSFAVVFSAIALTTTALLAAPNIQGTWKLAGAQMQSTGHVTPVTATMVVTYQTGSLFIGRLTPAGQSAKTIVGTITDDAPPRLHATVDGSTIDATLKSLVSGFYRAMSFSVVNVQVAITGTNGRQQVLHEQSAIFGTGARQ